MTDRTPLDDLTSDALDTLYDRLAKAERAVNLLADSHRRAEQAEAAVASVRTLATRWAVLRTHGGAAYELRAALDAIPDPGTVVITQARHDHLVAGQCIHHQETHRLHHGEPVTGCPYPGCWPDA